MNVKHENLDEANILNQAITVSFVLGCVCGAIGTLCIAALWSVL